ncbi:MAG: response regulator transcription factor [Mucilaginibacter sp.]|nr:response regulator transcription factor [Mucilaginibacter sp.]
MEPIQIALVDDHRLFRSGIASLINKLPQYKILFEAGDGEELTQKLTPKLKPHIVLLDINMPKKDGIATAQWLHSTYPDVKVIVLSMYENAEKVLQMIKLGVKGYLLKDAEPFEFEQALAKVSAGEVYYPEFVNRYLLNSFSEKPGLVKLNDREIEFLKMVGSDFTYKEIADQMCISTRTVDGYRDQLFEKLEIRSRVGLVLYAIKNNLIDL